MSELFPDEKLIKLAAARPENELLLLCAHRGGGVEATPRIRELAGGATDWDYLYRLAELHALLPLLYRGLEDAGASVPLAHRERLRGRYRDNATRNTLLAGELARIARLFEAEDIPLLAYKGPALAMQVYGGLALRRFIDLDVIVRRRDVARAGELLLSLGFVKPSGLTASQERFLLRWQHNLAYTGDGGRMIVELHWEVSPRPYASVPLDEGVWARAHSVQLFGAGVKSLSAEDLLIALSVHGTKHLWERLAWVCDIAALVNSQTDLDWQLVQRLARDSRLERMLHLSLRLAHGLSGARLPAEVLEENANAGVEGLAADVASRLFKGTDYKPAGLARNVVFNMRARARLREKASYLRFIFTPTDGDLTAVALPDGMSFLYYLLRPLRLVFKGDAGH